MGLVARSFARSFFPPIGLTNNNAALDSLCGEQSRVFDPEKYATIFANPFFNSK